MFLYYLSLRRTPGWIGALGIMVGTKGRIKPRPGLLIFFLNFFKTFFGGGGSRGHTAGRGKARRTPILISD